MLPRCPCGGVKTRPCQKTSDPSSGVTPFSRKHHTYGPPLHRSLSDDVYKVCTACSHTCLFPAHLYTTFGMASLRQAILRNIDLSGANLSGANLSGANL